MMIKLPEAGKVVSILSGGMDSSIMTILLTKHYGAENVLMSYKIYTVQSFHAVRYISFSDSPTSLILNTALHFANLAPSL